ncbi:hypothetical protein [Paracoccus pacificus]|uniref:Uncharacterized protein n=1 Tax=Paracoccus pacificus TaxID=1463598 RepID=A0ABW4R400_9RHOB
MRVATILVILFILALLALAGYAYLGDMAADPQPVRVPVQVDTNG